MRVGYQVGLSSLIWVDASLSGWMLAPISRLWVFIRFDASLLSVWKPVWYQVECASLTG